MSEQYIYNTTSARETHIVFSSTVHQIARFRIPVPAVAQVWTGVHVVAKVVKQPVLVIVGLGAHGAPVELVG